MEWRTISNFPDYKISESGEVYGLKRQAILRPSTTQAGVLKVALRKEGRYYTKTLASLVAETFLEPSDLQTPTPIHLDGDRMNCHCTNLSWRPRYYAVMYHRQFDQEQFGMLRSPLIELRTDTVYPGLSEACINLGLVWGDIVASIGNQDWTRFGRYRFMHYADYMQDGDYLDR